MAGPQARAIVGPLELTLDLQYPLPAGPIVLAVAGHRTRNVRLDGRRTRLSSGVEGLAALDLTRSTGFHRLEVDGEVFWFGTKDAKLGLEGIEAMLAHLRTLGTGWTGQALFSDGTGLRDAHVLYAWLDEWADRALLAIAGILAAPRPAIVTARTLSRRGGAGVLLAPTLRLLRSAPRQYLNENAAGLIQVDGKGYDPLRVVMRKRTTTLDTVANRRAVAVLHWLSKLCREVLVSAPDTDTRTRCRLWLNEAEKLQRRPLAQSLRRSTGSPTAARQAEEATERRYRQSYEVARDLQRGFGWSATLTPLPRFSYVERADTIYQAYAASCLAAELGLTQTDGVLGSRPLAFTGPQFDLYYDTRPPSSVLASWRALSARPDDSRPDLLLHERSTGRIAILDAKYRRAKDGGASEDSRKDVSAYLGLYGVHGISIVFPGEGTGPEVVSGRGRRIVEVPLVPPAANLAASVPAILATLDVPPY